MKDYRFYWIKKAGKTVFVGSKPKKRMIKQFLIGCLIVPGMFLVITLIFAVFIGVLWLATRSGLYLLIPLTLIVGIVYAWPIKTQVKNEANPIRKGKCNGCY